MKVVKTFSELINNRLYLYDDGKESRAIRITKINPEARDADILILPDKEESFISETDIKNQAIHDISTLKEKRELKAKADGIIK